jgi:hypothetical protein
VRVTGRPAVVATKVEDKIEKDGDNRIVFSSKTTDEIDGFDFTAGPKVAAIRFNLEIDNRVLPGRVEYGEKNMKATAIPLVVRIQ